MRALYSDVWKMEVSWLNKEVFYFNGWSYVLYLLVRALEEGEVRRLSPLAAEDPSCMVKVSTPSIASIDL